jgi:FkbM family methyltransferase
MKIIYDVGANNGDNIPYYLQKADLVVAIEANPALADAIKRRFQPEISAGRLAVESCVVTANRADDATPFYIHKEQHFLGQFPRPPDTESDKFEKIEVQSKTLISIIGAFGPPHYVKIDVERFDKVLLKSLFRHGVFPPYVSAESHDIGVFATFVAIGGYNAFKLVDGKTVPVMYGHHRIATASGPARYSFPPHSAGPFGEDIFGPWRTAAEFFKILADAGLGWKDVHVSNVDQPRKP